MSRERRESQKCGLRLFLPVHKFWLNEKVTSTGLRMKPIPEKDPAVTFSRVMA